MQFREQGKKIQCIRSIYDPAIKRCHQRVICTFDRAAQELPTEGLEGLTGIERQELAAWFDARQSRNATLLNRQRVNTGGQTLFELAAAIRACEVTDAEASAIWDGVAEVAKALKKAGHPKPTKTRNS
ncbi:MAG: hypothetical protein IE913_07745 [Halothiobacillus sp.]|nr:hypothetical protein [Halothiobacillus sp.]